MSQKNPRNHKNKIGTPSPPKPKLPPPPPPKSRNFMIMGFPCRENALFQAPIKLAQPFPAAELRTKKFTDTRIFLSEFSFARRHWILKSLRWGVHSEPLRIANAVPKGRNCHQRLAPVLVIISRNSLAFSRKMITTWFLPVLQLEREELGP